MKKKYFLILPALYFFSCADNSIQNNKKIKGSEININFSVNDLSLISSDSLLINFNFVNPDSSSIKASWYTKSDLSGEFNFKIDSLNNIYKSIPVSQEVDSLFIKLSQNDIVTNYFDINIPRRQEKNVLIISDEKSIFKELIENNRLFNSEIIKTEKFKKYNFNNSDILIIENVNDFSNNLISEIQKFMLLQKPILVMMSNPSNDKLFLSQTLDYPDVKATRGTSKNQFFSLKNEYSEKYLSTNKDEFQIYRFFEIKNFNHEEVFFTISTNDPLVIKKNIFGSDILFIATQLDSVWSNEFFNEFVYDIFLELVYDQVIVNES
jgi:hypothetical protein|tara:strand:- start:2504 stop:3469 length:966 start_codon:yes stop_codon:yes gene_type:complete